MNQLTILLNPRDDVATALTQLSKGQTVHAALAAISYDTELLEDIAFGHKYALHDIRQGEPVLKYGLPIGKALVDIQAGQWVHVHNCRSHRFGYRHEQYGVNA